MRQKETSSPLRSRMLGGAFGFLLLAAAAVPAGAQSPSAMPGSFAPLIARVKPAVVNISTTELENSVDRRQLPQMPQFPPGSPFGEFFRYFNRMNPGEQHGPPLKALGSGFIVDPSGYIVTNNHVVKNGTNIEVTLQDGTTLKAKLVGHDDLTDLAVLKVSADHPLPYVQFGDSEKAEVGDWVISVGNPFGLGGTVTAGILSARGRDIHEGPYDDFLQIDAPINQGNSGGPTFDEQGQVIGINTAILSPNGGGSVGIGFAIPSNLAKDVVAQLEKSGSITRGWLGVAIQAIQPDMEDALGVKGTNGALVASVTPDSPAAHAGLKPGDIITAFDGQAVKRVRDLTWAVANTAPDKKATLTVSRGGEELHPTVTVGRLAEHGRTEQASAEQPHLGLQLAPINDQTRQDFDLPDGLKGVVVANVAPGSPADNAGIQAGDVITSVNRKPVHTPRQVADEVAAAKQHGRKSIALDINRGGQEQFVPVQIEPGK